MAKKILIIDDDPITVHYLETLFRDSGYETCSAMESSKGLEVAESERPDLITLDLQMPGDWGPRFYRKLRAKPDLKEIPIIVISALDGHHSIKDAVAFVPKPFDSDRLIGLVRRTLGE